MALVYGRRSEFEANVEATQHRANLFNWREEHLISFDRLEPQHAAFDFPTVRENGAGRYKAIAVPPTFRLSAYFALSLPLIDGLEDAIHASAEMSNERKQFLIDRLDYWRDWAINKQNRVTTSGCE